MNQDNVEIGIQQIVMTLEMLQQLIQGMTLSPNVNVQNLERRNFAKCSVRFNSEQGTNVNAFIRFHSCIQRLRKHIRRKCS